MIIYGALLRKGARIKNIVVMSFQLNDVLVIQNIFAFVCRSRQSTGELVEINVSTCENLSSSYLGLKLASVCGRADSVYYSGSRPEENRNMLTAWHLICRYHHKELICCVSVATGMTNP